MKFNTKVQLAEYINGGENDDASLFSGRERLELRHVSRFLDFCARLHVAKTKASKRGEFAHILEEILQVKREQFQRYALIGEKHAVFMPCVNVLPRSKAAIYSLSTMTSVQLAHELTSGAVNPAMTREDVDKIKHDLCNRDTDKDLEEAPREIDNTSTTFILNLSAQEKDILTKTLWIMLASLTD